MLPRPQGLMPTGLLEKSVRVRALAASRTQRTPSRFNARVAWTERRSPNEPCLGTAAGDGARDCAALESTALPPDCVAVKDCVAEGTGELGCAAFDESEAVSVSCVALCADEHESSPTPTSAPSTPLAVIRQSVVSMCTLLAGWRSLQPSQALEDTGRTPAGQCLESPGSGSGFNRRARLGLAAQRPPGNFRDTP